MWLRPILLLPVQLLQARRTYTGTVVVVRRFSPAVNLAAAAQTFRRSRPNSRSVPSRVFVGRGVFVIVSEDKVVAGR